MACVREGQVPGTELAADSVSWQGNARGLRTVSEQDLSGSVAETQGLISLLPQWVYPALVLEALHERLQFQPGNDKSNMPGRKQTAAPGNQEGRIRYLDPRKGKGPWPHDSKHQIRGLQLHEKRQWGKMREHSTR